MKQSHGITRPIKVSELTFEDLYQEISQDWQEKAKRLQARRWRMLKHDSKRDRPLITHIHRKYKPSSIY